MNPPTANFAKHPAWKIWSNPIFRRYCRSRLRPAGLGIALLVTLIIAGFITAMSYTVSLGEGLSPSDAARTGIIGLLVFQGIILFVLGTAQVSGGMTAERDEGVIDYQRLIPMTPITKVLGYLAGLPVREYAMFLLTVPFTAWCLWRGEVAINAWLPLYGVVFSSTILYHFTGLVTGTVVRNRRWAFLVSIGLVFSLYTVVPQMSRFGLVFFKYLTINPVLQETMPHILPRAAGSVVQTIQNLVPTVKFFGLDFSESVFTWFTQTGLILTFVAMLHRRWRRAESHLLNKLWAAGLYIWIQILLLGNALPIIETGEVFPSRGISGYIHMTAGWKPSGAEAVALCGIYGFASMMLLFMLITIVTPNVETQIRGWRRAAKVGKTRVPFLSDAATSFWCVILMSLAGAAGWYLFTRGLVESRWFPGHFASPVLLGYFSATLLAFGLVCQSLLENKGARFMGLMVILVGVLPLLIGAVLATSDALVPVSIWLFGVSPLSMPFYATGSLLTMSETPLEISRAMPRAYHFWLMVLLVMSVWSSLALRKVRKARSARMPALGES